MKVKIEICDNNGEQVTVAVNGHMTKERILQILSVFEKAGSHTKVQEGPAPTKTAMDKTLEVIKSQLHHVWFTSKDLLLVYSEQYKENIKSSTISTYLTRLHANGYLERKGNRSCWQYKVVNPIATKNIEDIVGRIKK